MRLCSITDRFDEQSDLLYQNSKWFFSDQVLLCCRLGFVVSEDLFRNKTQALNHDLQVRWIDDEKLRKETRTFLPELQTGKWGSIKINWKVQNVNRDNSASWPAVTILIQSATRTLVTSLARRKQHFASVFLRDRIEILQLACNTTPCLLSPLAIHPSFITLCTHQRISD